MDIETKIHLEIDSLSTYVVVGEEVEEIEENAPVLGSTVLMLTDDLKENLGRDLRHIVERLLRLEERVDSIK